VAGIAEQERVGFSVVVVVEEFMNANDDFIGLQHS
jgi:hypothetical protein